MAFLFLLIVLIEKGTFAAALRTVRCFITLSPELLGALLAAGETPTAEDWEDFPCPGEQHCSREGKLPWCSSFCPAHQPPTCLSLAILLEKLRQGTFWPLEEVKNQNGTIFLLLFLKLHCTFHSPGCPKIL